MNVAGAVHTAGSRPLKDFSFGETVVVILNSSLSNDHTVTLDTTGKQIIELLDNLPRREKNLILSIVVAEFDEHGEIIPPENHFQFDTKMTIGLIFSLLLVAMSATMTYKHYTTADANTTSTVNTIINGIVEILKAVLSS